MEPRGLLLIAQMSTKDSLNADRTLVDMALQAASQYPDFVCGFICQQKLVDTTGNNIDPGLLYCAPGVSLTLKDDSLGQRYRTPDEVIGKYGYRTPNTQSQLSQMWHFCRDACDIIIVGRSITSAEDPLVTAKKYREAGWAAYEKALSGHMSTS